MPLSDKAINLLLAPFAISPIIKWCGFPGVIGLLIAAAGLIRDIAWLKVAGAILAAPVIWCSFVLFFIYFPLLILDRLLGGRIAEK